MAAANLWSKSAAATRWKVGPTLLPQPCPLLAVAGNHGTFLDCLTAKLLLAAPE